MTSGCGRSSAIAVEFQQPDLKNNANHIWVMSPENGSSVPQQSKFRPSPNGSSNSNFCRICHEGDGLESLVSPCKCTGTLALIHASCLEHWLTSSNTDKCEICKHQFQTTREPRTYSEYIQDSSNQFNVRNLVADIVCFCLLTPLLVVSTYLCSLGAQQYFAHARWEAIGLIVLAIFLLAVYYTWCHVTLKYHIGVWMNWKETHQRVRLVEIISCRQLPSAHHQPDDASTPLNPNSDVTDFPRSRSRSSPAAVLQIDDPEDAVFESELNESDTSKIIV